MHSAGSAGVDTARENGHTGGMNGRRRALRWLAVIFGNLGMLLCIGGVVGLYFVNDRTSAATEKARRAVDDLLAGVQEGVAAAGPEVAALRERMVVRAAEELLPELRADIDGVRRFLDNVARIGEAAVGIFEALDDRPLAETLSARIGELQDAVRELSEFRVRDSAQPLPRPVLARIETLLAEVHRDLTTLRLQVSLVHSDVDHTIGLVLLLAGQFLIWMGIGQWCLSRAGRG